MAVSRANSRIAALVSSIRVVPTGKDLILAAGLTVAGVVAVDLVLLLVDRIGRCRNAIETQRHRARLRAEQQEQIVLSDGVERSAEDERRYRHIVLPGSGISILLCSDARAEKRAAAAMCVDGAGARTAPSELVGLAHYLEHMLFLGSKKYPDESHYKKVVALHNGRCNASTAPEKTVYHFEVDVSGLEATLDIFAQFFVGEPLMDAGAAERELNAVTAEDSRNRINDDRRKRMVIQHTVADKRAGSQTWAKFGTGNASTLDAAAAARASCAVRQALLAYRERFYRTDKMSLALVSASSLDELEALVLRLFGGESQPRRSPSPCESPSSRGSPSPHGCVASAGRSPRP